MTNGLIGFPEIAAVLRHYPGLAVEGMAPQSGGFSGARLFRLVGKNSACALRFWPADRTAPEIRVIHALMIRARNAGSAVPSLLQADTGQTLLEWRGSLVEIVTWLPGEADFTPRPTAARVRAACGALVRLHNSWAGGGGRTACLSVRRRLASLERWKETRGAGFRPPVLAEACRLVERWLSPAAASLEMWSRETFDVQPCLCDIWRAHVLFTGDEVTGLVDFGSVKEDHVAADLARLLGSLAEDDEALWTVGLGAYAEQRPLSPRERELARALDRTGAVVALTHWLRWLGLGERRFVDEAAAFGRLEALVARVRKWTRFAALEVQ